MRAIGGSGAQCPAAACQPAGPPAAAHMPLCECHKVRCVLMQASSQQKGPAAGPASRSVAGGPAGGSGVAARAFDTFCHGI